jgi:putative salt-induced outer membrane protein YdiY
MRRELIAAILACTSGAALADDAAPVAYKSRASFSAAYASGNSTSRRLYGDAELTARAPEYRYQLGGKVERRSEEAAADSVSVWRASANRDRFLDPARFVYVRAALEHDGAKDLARRASAGAGYGADLVRGAQAQLSLRGGLDLVEERRYGFEPRSYPALGWALKASYALAGTRTELFHEHDGLRDLREGGVVLHSKTGVRIPVLAKLSATVQLNVDWESRPAPGRKPTDATLLIGATYDW